MMKEQRNFKVFCPDGACYQGIETFKSAKKKAKEAIGSQVYEVGVGVVYTSHEPFWYKFFRFFIKLQHLMPSF
jgi:hypothetical protein